MALTPEEQKAAIEELTGAADLSADAVDKLTDRLRKQAEATIATVDQHRKAMDSMASSVERRLQAEERGIDLAQAQLNLAVSNKEKTAEQVRDEQKLIDLKRESLAVTRQSVKAAADLGKNMAGAFRLSGVGNFSEKLSGVVSAFKGGADSAAAFGGALSSGLASVAFDNIVGLAVKLIDTEAAFRKATGASKEYARGVTSTYEATRRYGVSAEEASSATMALYRSFTDFSYLLQECATSWQRQPKLWENSASQTSHSHKQHKWLPRCLVSQLARCKT